VVNYPTNHHGETENTETRRRRKTVDETEREASTPLDPEKARRRVFERAGKLLAANSVPSQSFASVYWKVEARLSLSSIL